MMVFLFCVSGISMIIEIVFENCFMYVEEFCCMNGDIKIEGCFVIINGFVQFQGVEVVVIDLCVGVVLIFVGLVVEGYICVIELKYLDCGYVDFYKKFVVIGVDIECVNDEFVFE